MIQPLRTAHRRVFVMLALLLPAILVIGLGARHIEPTPSTRVSDLPANAHMVTESGSLWQRNKIQTKFYSVPDHPQEIKIVLEPAEELTEPDPLLYWTATVPQADSLPPNSRLVGTFVPGKSFTLPLNGDRTGYLVLYSLAHQAVSDTAHVENLP